jgi:hypothetical protein
MSTNSSTNSSNVKKNVSVLGLTPIQPQSATRLNIQLTELLPNESGKS